MQYCLTHSLSCYTWKTQQRYTKKTTKTYFCGQRRQWVNLALPLDLLRAKTFLPFFVDILFMKPCSFFLWSFLGWYVLFIFSILLSFMVILEPTDASPGLQITAYTISYAPYYMIILQKNESVKGFKKFFSENANFDNFNQYYPVSGGEVFNNWYICSV